MKDILRMIDPNRFSRLKFDHDTETLAFSQKIAAKSLHPVGSGVKSRYSKIIVRYVPDESRSIDQEWLASKAPRSGDDVFAICQAGFELYRSLEPEGDVSGEFSNQLKDGRVFPPGSLELFQSQGFPAFFEIGTIEFVRKENAIIFGGCLEDFSHLSEHGADIAQIGAELEFGGNGDFDYLYESSPYE